MQSIFIEHLEAQTVIGVYPEERERARPLVFDIEIDLPSRRGFSSDSLADTIDYDQVVALIRRELLSHSFQLLERLAQHLCETIERETAASRVRIKISKAGAVPGTRSVGVILERDAPRVEALFGPHLSTVRGGAG